MTFSTTQIIFFGFIGFVIIRIVWERLFGKKTSKEDDGVTGSGLMAKKKKVFFGMFTPKQRQAGKVTEMDSNAFGFPYFYNEIDHTRGRFVHWFRKKIDEADERKEGLYRAKVLSDATFLWFFKISRELITPCVFRPGIDAIQLLPGEQPGVPPEGMVIFKRSMDGKFVSPTASYNRWRAMYLTEKHEKNMLDDMLSTLLSKDKLEASALTSKESTDKMIQLLKRLRKIQSAAGSGGGSGGDYDRYGNQYSDEVYGGEEDTPQNEGVWNLEGGGGG